MKSSRGRRSTSHRVGKKPPRPKFTPTKLRIVSGTLGGRKIAYNGDPATRPMKERTRESVFSLLGGHLDNTWTVDLFAGTGILAFEAVSRGSTHAILFESSCPTVTTILENMFMLGLGEQVVVHHADTLRWLRNATTSTADWSKLPWVVFCCPPYALWNREQQPLCDGIAQLYASSPVGSQFVCETDRSFDLAAALPNIEWRVREYEPAVISIAAK